MNINALLNTLSSRCRTLPIVILHVTEACNLRCITCSYRSARPNELSLSEIIHLADGLKDFGLRHIVYSGGEPLMRRDLPDICAAFARNGVKQSLLTNGLLLDKRLPEIDQYFSEIIVSIDGPNDKVDSGIRGVDSFELIVKGVKKAIGFPGKRSVSVRTVIQKKNFRYILCHYPFTYLVYILRKILYVYSERRISLIFRFGVSLIEIILLVKVSKD
jgi:MoaA/NifB/PqqE/SkfB family radical SAM enzyme